MIAIINISTHNDRIGENTYRLQINKLIVGEFTHIRNDGLAVCLEKAAECARDAEKMERNKWLKAYADLMEDK